MSVHMCCDLALLQYHLVCTHTCPDTCLNNMSEHMSVHRRGAIEGGRSPEQEIDTIIQFKLEQVVFGLLVCSSLCHDPMANGKHVPNTCLNTYVNIC